MAIHTVLLAKRKLLLRPDVLPFVALYVYLTFFNPVQEEIYANLMLIAVALLNCIAYLMNFWSARANSFIEFSKLDLNESNFKRATHIRICSQKKGRGDVYSISVLEKDAKGNAFFHFHNKKYYWSSENKTFERIKPKLDHELSYYREFKKPAEKDIEHFDKNRCDIPLPTFNKLLKDQLIEPFSFFQFFSVGLWLLDENRFYSLFTMFLIFMTSCTVVIQRMRTMFMLKKMVLAPQHIYTFQANKWVKISSEDLKPGDLCMIQPSDSIKIVEGSQNDESFASLLPFANLLPKKIQQLPQTQESTDNHKVLPCDFLVLSGNCIVNESILTGESIPQIKDSIQGIKNIEEQFDIKKKHKNNVLYCGTEVIQTFPAENLPENIGKKLPVQGCLGYVLRTGYDTAKGKLTRTVIHNTENLSIKQGEAFILIFILLVISVIASLRVLIPGLEDPDRDKNKLFLRCILIITTVVPPELPMILTMAVNSSLVYLQRKRIFCTEPFRIPLAGKVDTCAFDKTGTLTKDDLIYRGVVDDFQGSSHPIKTELDSLSKEAQFIMAGCHSLVSNGGKLLGDPIEKAIFIHYKWNFSSNDKIASFSGKKARIIQFHPFQSDLRRMSTLISYFENDVQRGFRAVVKGAPETMQLLYKPTSIPKDYETVYRQYAKKGYRILALGYKKMPEDITLSELVREDLESDLEFAGFLLFESILKSDTAKYIKYLQDAAYSITMITGDSELTACSVSRQLKLTPLQDHLLLEENDKNELVWMNEDFEIISKATEKKEVAELAKKYTLALNGKALKHIETHFTLQNIKNIVDYTTVFARVSPSQKEYIIETMKSNGRGVIMCGDGTNDVGGLKKADIGLALVGMKDEEEAAKIRREKKEKIKKHQEEMRLQMMQGRMPQRPAPDAFAEMFSDMPEYKPGDASIAAPFTSKHSNSIKCVPLVLRQGVCTLATTFQTYRILSMSCLVSAYTMSALHMQNTKFSETQSTVLGILGAMNYFFYSNTKPLKKLTSIRPPSTIWEPYFICSVISQVCIQLYFMERCVSDIGLKYTTEEDLKLLKEQDFRPTFINSVVFIHSIVSQTCVFLFNYGGQPFMESLSKNKTYLKVLLFTLFVSLLLAANSSDDLNYFLELTFTGVPQSVLYELLMNLAIMAFLNYTVEKLLRFLKYGKFYDIF